MQTVHTADEVRAALAASRAASRRVALVPTMGNLHAGHIALVDRAHEIADHVVVSLFVNPYQFAEGEDFEGYPRTLEEDFAALRARSVDLVFNPLVTELYPRGTEAITRVEVPELGAILCGASRPGFFRGVATVVNVLFNIVQPDVALFGEKDFQQRVIIQRMVEDLRMPIRIEPVATVREADGLALSSRNSYLTSDERARAPALYRALCEARDRVRGGDRDFAAIGRRGMQRLEDAGFRPDYFTVRRADDLGTPDAEDDDLVVLGAAWLGRARLIDNVRTR